MVYTQSLAEQTHLVFIVASLRLWTWHERIKCLNIQKCALALKPRALFCQPHVIFMCRSCHVSLVMCDFKCICPQQHTLFIKKKISAFFSDPEFLLVLNVRGENKILRSTLTLHCCFKPWWGGEGWAMCKQWMNQTTHELERLWREAKGNR